MPITEAQKKAMKSYMERIKGTPQGEKIRLLQLESQKVYFNKKYATNPEFKEAHKKYMRERYHARKALLTPPPV